MSTTFEVRGPCWRWTPEPPAKASWFFLTIDGQTAAEMRYEAMGRTGGFGSIKVAVMVGDTRWTTSVFPHKANGGFLLPLKVDVRRAEGIVEGEEVKARIEV